MLYIYYIQLLLYLLFFIIDSILILLYCIIDNNHVYIIRNLFISSYVIKITSFIIYLLNISITKKQLINYNQLQSIPTDNNINLLMFSHDIRTPLTSIIFAINLIKQNNNIQSEYIDIVIYSSNYLLLLFTSLLEFNNLSNSTIKYKQIKTYTFFNEIIQILHSQCYDTSIKLYLIIEHNVPSIFISDNVKIKMIIFNLIINSINELKLISIENYLKKISCFIKFTNGHLIIAIEDSGSGLSTDNIFKFTNSDTSTKNKLISEHNGYSIGTAIIKKYIALLNGSINIKSKYNNNTNTLITIHIPIQINRYRPIFNKKIYHNNIIHNITDGISNNTVISNLYSFFDTKTPISLIKPYTIIETNTTYQLQYNNNMTTINKPFFNITILKKLYDLINTPNTITATEDTDELTEPLCDISTNIKSNANLISDYKILIVDDNHINVLLLKKNIDLLNIYCDVAYDGKQAINKTLSTNYNLIILDYNMPELNGIETANEIKKKNKYTLIYILTGDTSIQHTTSPNIEQILLKPININELYNIIHKNLLLQYSLDVSENSDITSPLNTTSSSNIQHQYVDFDNIMN